MQPMFFKPTYPVPLLAILFSAVTDQSVRLGVRQNQLTLLLRRLLLK